MDARISSLNNAYVLGKKLEKSSAGKAENLFELLNTCIQLFKLNPSEKIKKEVEVINQKVLNLKSSDEIFKAYNFYNTLISNVDSSLNDLKLKEYFLLVYDRITEYPDFFKENRPYLVDLRNNSWTMLLNKYFKTALKGLQVCWAADSTNEYTMCYITMAYILNNQFDKAARIFNKWKDMPIKGYEFISVYTIGDGFLWWIDFLENRGFHHPDFKRAKELLKK